MGEKKGDTGTLDYPFNTADELEVQIPSGTWCRVTPREFRSHSWPRRIVSLSGVTPYEGPIYLYGTNKILKQENITKPGICFVDNIDPRKIKDERAYGRL